MADRDHEHDWRADPKGYVYLSSPPAQKLVCAMCGATKFRRAEAVPSPADVNDWPKVDVDD